MPARLTVAFYFTAVLSAVSYAAVPVVEPTGTWSGKIKDESRRKVAPQSGFIADAESWKKLWTTWRPGEEMPKVDFDKELVLVGAVSGPNLVIMRPTIGDNGDVRFVVGGTKMAGPGFGYKLIKVSRDGVKAVNGNVVTAVKPTAEDSITVTIVGTLRTGTVAIGGETTGTTITAKGITWELDFGNHTALRNATEKWQGKQVIVQGSLERRRGVEIRERWIVTVTGLQSIGGAGLGGNPKPDFRVTAGRTDTLIHFASEADMTIFDISSDFGIDSATIKRESANWPESMLVRLHLRGLESFRATRNEIAVEWSVSSTGKHAERVSLRKGRNESALDEKSPYHSEVRIVGGDGKIPLNDGYFAVPPPAKLFEGNPEEITLRWIDFFRD